MVVKGTITATRTVGAASVIVMPRSLANAAVGVRAIFGNVSAMARGSLTLVANMDHVAWTVDTTASAAYIATGGATSDASAMTTMSAHLAVVGIVTGRDTISASGVFAFASHPGEQPLASPPVAQPLTAHLTTPTVTDHPWFSSAGALTHHWGAHTRARPAATTGRFDRSTSCTPGRASARPHMGLTDGPTGGWGATAPRPWSCIERLLAAGDRALMTIWRALHLVSPPVRRPPGRAPCRSRERERSLGSCAGG